MFQWFAHRGFHYLLLLVVWAVLCLPNLGAPSLWDIDEGNNAECSHEMDESGNWVVPMFNYHLRFDKPPLLYWLQIAAYNVFGVNEFAARLPSALAALTAVLAAYELGRRMFGLRVGLLSGLMLASTICFCGAGHFANPDALLNACTLWTLALFFYGYRRGGGWWSLATGVTTGLGMLAKGPVALVLPSAVMLLFLLWERQLRRLWDWRMLGGVLAFLLVAAPWYVWVGLETKGKWLYEFFYNQNMLRFLLRTGMENHGGPIYYYVLGLVAGFAPWSIFLGLAVWNAVVELRAPVAQQQEGKRSLLSFCVAFLSAYLRTPFANPTRSAVRLLVCWIGVYFVFFSLSGTKLPNYILPLYPALAILMARPLDRYRRGDLQPPAWTLHLGVICLGFLGLGLALALLIVGGVLPWSVLRGRFLPGVEIIAFGGLIPLVGSVLAWWQLRQDCRTAWLATLTVTAVGFTAVVAAWGPAVVDRYKAPRELVRLLPADQISRDVRIATYDYFQPSLVFYSQREVEPLEREQQVQDFLDGPLPSYLILRADEWEQLRTKLHGVHHLLGSRFDLYDNAEIVVVGNEPVN